MTKKYTPTTLATTTSFKQSFVVVKDYLLALPKSEERDIALEALMQLADDFIAKGVELRKE